jgi:hypothetical protein
MSLLKFSFAAGIASLIVGSLCLGAELAGYARASVIVGDAIALAVFVLWIWLAAAQLRLPGNGTSCCTGATTPQGKPRQTP